jgi:hypothetical protein
MDIHINNIRFKNINENHSQCTKYMSPCSSNGAKREAEDPRQRLPYGFQAGQVDDEATQADSALRKQRLEAKPHQPLAATDLDETTLIR